MQKLLKTLTDYHPQNEQETHDKMLMLTFLKRHPDALYRTNLTAHMTSSIVVLNPSKTKILLGFHRIYHAWGWFGGHSDGEEDSYAVALKEVQEETGLTQFTAAPSDIIALDVIGVQNHLKQGVYVPDHLHLNVTYGFYAPDDVPLNHNISEHKAIQWFALENFLDHIDEARMKPIYQKIVTRMLAGHKKR